MSYNVKNYTEQGGEKTVIGGTLEIKEGAELAGFPKAENQADSTAVHRRFVQSPRLRRHQDAV